ncbi:hypothetical protein EZS27_014802 [termite gut metagenome]|uniref:Phosphate-selective porin O and P n=1 Tax=termite gut metagenome TaxID=433724 RepID=A0A5J4RVC5_9ZZZZ
MKKSTWLLLALAGWSGVFAQENKAQKMKTAFQSEAFQLTGYGQVIYKVDEQTNSIDIARAFLTAKGKLGAENRFGYLLSYDFAGSKLHELYGEWTPLKGLNARFGQFKIPFTLENPISSSRMETINGARSVSAMSGGTGDVNADEKGSKSGRDAGFQLSGFLFPRPNFPLLEYAVGLFNGAGMNTQDVDNRKDFIASLYLQPVKSLRLGTSVYAGRLNNDIRNRMAFSAEYQGKRWYSRAEYIAAKDGNSQRNGHYGLLVWKITPDKWEALGKYEYYTPEKSITNNNINDYTLGVNYYFAYLCRLQLNYIYSEDRLHGNNKAVMAQMQLFF